MISLRVSKQLLCLLFLARISSSAFAEQNREQALQLASLSSLAQPELSISTLPQPFEQYFVEISLNGMKADRISLILKNKETLYLKEQDWQHYRLKLPGKLARIVQGDNYYPLDLPGLDTQLDQQQLRLAISANAERFEDNDLSQSFQRVQPQQADFGAYLTYDLFHDVVREEQTSNGFLEFNGFTPWGNFSTEELVASDSTQRSATRLNSRWRKDDPDAMRSYIIGDSVTTPGTWGNSVLFAGLQIKSDFSMQPNFAPFPTTAIAGEALLPSTVDLYLDNINLFSEKIPPGNFNIDFRPPNIGEGMVTLVTTDLLGRQQVISLPFYANSLLLQPGVHQYGFEAGLVRQNFGLRNFDYSDVFAAATDTFGVTKRWTQQLRAEVQENAAAIGSSSFIQVARNGIATVITAGSKTGRQQGGSATLGYDIQQHPLNTGFRATVNSRDFRLLGQAKDALAARALLQARVGYSTQHLGSFNVALADQNNRAKDRQRFLTGNYSKNLSKEWMMTLSIIANLRQSKASSVFLNFFHQISRNQNANFSFSGQRGNLQKRVRFSARPTDDNDKFSYEFSGTSGRENHTALATIKYNSDYGIYSSQYERRNNQESFRFSGRGSISLLKGQWNLSQPIDDSFAIVYVPDMPGLKVKQDNRVVATTNSHGYAFLPQLFSYTPNQISLPGEKLPLNTEFTHLRQEIIPSFASGVYLPFEVKKSLNALLTLQTDDHQALPPGTEVSPINQPEKKFPVGYEGELYLNGLESDNQFIASWSGQACRFNLKITEQDQPIQQLGVIYCHG